MEPKGSSSKISSSKKKESVTPSPAKSSTLQPGSNTGIFSRLNVFVLQAGLGKARTELFKKQLGKHGALVQSSVDDQTTHVIVDEEMTYPRLCRILKYKESSLPSHLKVVKATWLSSCLSDEKALDPEEYILVAPVRVDKRIKLFDEEDMNSNPKKFKAEERDEKQIPVDAQNEDQIGNAPLINRSDLQKTSPTKKMTARDYDSDDSNYVPSDESDGEDNSKEDVLSSDAGSSSNVSTPSTSPVKLPRGNWVCSKPSTSQHSNPNPHITEKLELLMKAYENTRDKWRALGYKKAITALKNHGKEVTTWEEANSIPGIGTKLADKIWEIIESGHLRKIDFVCKGEEMEAIDLFNNVWGAGPTVARDWVQQGFRTLEDLSKRAKLTKQQQIGLKHYEEFLDRMSRDEAGDIERTVREAAESLFPGMLAVVCGSYRRGKKTCGDVDVLITHPDGKSHKGALSKILNTLRQTGFITDDLIRVEEKGEQKKYMGVCRLPGENHKHRRIDIIVAPYNEYPCALVHFTGSGHFNRSMRALAKKKGMSLSEHALRTGVVRRGQEKIHEGTPLPVHSEEDIFRHLGLEYRQPYERDY